MKAYLFIILFCFCNSHIVKAQKITLIDNLNNSDRGYGDGSVVYKNSLYFKYGGSKILLAKFDGSKITPIDIPNLGYFSGIVGHLIVFKDNLYFIYRNPKQKCQLAKFDGIKVTLVDNPDDGEIESNSGLFTFNNNLYFIYSPKFSGNELAKFDGVNIKLFTNPAKGIIGYSHIIYMNNLYLGFRGDLGKLQLAKFDGYQIALIINPDADGGIASDAYGNIFWATYNNNLYLGYNSSEKIQLAKYNGSKINLIANPDNGEGICSIPVSFNNALYFRYQNENLYNNQLAKYDGNSVSLINNLDAAKHYVSIGYSAPIVYNNQIYFYYTSLDNNRKLGQCKGLTTISFDNPKKEGIDGNGNVIIYNNKLYFNLGMHLGEFDGTKIKAIENPDAGRIAPFQDNELVIFKNDLYFVYWNTFQKYQLARLEKQ